MSGRGYPNRSRQRGPYPDWSWQRGRTPTGVGREVVPWLESAERSMSRLESGERSVPLAEKSVPLAERLVPTADEKSEWGDKPTTPSLFNCSRQFIGERLYIHSIVRAHIHFPSMATPIMVACLADWTGNLNDACRLLSRVDPTP